MPRDSIWLAVDLKGEEISADARSAGQQVPEAAQGASPGFGNRFGERIVIHPGDKIGKKTGEPRSIAPDIINRGDFNLMYDLRGVPARKVFPHMNNKLLAASMLLYLFM